MAARSGYMKSVMTSYNRINGTSAASQYDLLTTITRGEWGFDGIVMTDWWTLVDAYDGSSASHSNIAEDVMAQNDLFMVIKDTVTYENNLKDMYEKGVLTLGQLQRSAKNILSFAMNTLAFKAGRRSEFDNLQEATELVFEHSLSGVGARIGKAEDSVHFIGKKIYEITAEVDTCGFYCAELEYVIDDDILSQHRVSLAVDNKENLGVLCQGTEGEKNTTRLKVYLKEKTSLIFADDYVKAVRIYKLK